MKLLKKFKLKHLIIIVTIILLVTLSLIINKDSSKEYISSNSSTVLVTIKGEIKNPGTYEVNEYARVLDVVRKAGGITYLGNESKVNLADKVSDGMIINVPQKTLEGLINLNSCCESDLEKLKYLGLTDTSIKAIISYANSNGFTNKEELLTNIGIKENVYNKIKEYIIL